jgi:hypothetical protein
VSKREAETELRPIGQRRVVLAGTAAASSSAVAREGLPLGILKLESERERERTEVEWSGWRSDRGS